MPVARAMAPTGTTVGGGGQALEADGAMVQGLADHPKALVMVRGLALARARARGLATGLVGAVLVVVVMGLELVLEVLEVLATVEEEAARVATGIAHPRSLGTK